MRRRRTLKTETKGRVVGYVRVSTEDQAVNGISLDAQRSRIESYAFATGLELDEIVTDHGASAKTLERLGLRQIIDQVRNGHISTVIVLKLDRLTRSTKDLSELLDLFSQTSSALVSVSESLDTASAAGRMVVNMLGVVAQWEREAVAERTVMALAHKRSQRLVYGPTPFGYLRDGNKLIVQSGKQEILEQAIRLDHEGKSFREIASFLTQSGCRPKRGTTWHASSVRAMLRSKIARERASELVPS